VIFREDGLARENYNIPKPLVFHAFTSRAAELSRSHS